MQGQDRFVDLSHTTEDGLVSYPGLPAPCITTHLSRIDDTGGGSRPSHSLLLAQGIPIVEHLCNLEHLPEEGFRFFAVPPRVRGLGSFPVWALALYGQRAG